MSLKDDKRRGTDSDPAGLALGFVMVPHYAQYFWRPYLGLAAFALWETLLSFCYGKKDTAWPSVSRLSRVLTNSDNSRHVVRGRIRRDHGRERFVPGALQVLEREGLVRVTGADDRGGADAGRGAAYVFRVRKSLPLLRPEQVSRLSPSLQRDHARYLARAEASNQKAGALDNAPNNPDGAPYNPDGVPDDWDTAPDDPDGVPDDGDKGAETGDGTNNNFQEDPKRIDDRWKKVVSQLSLQLDPAVWDKLVKLTEGYMDTEGEVLTITGPNQYDMDFLEHRLAKVLQRAVKLVYERELELRFEWREEE